MKTLKFTLALFALLCIASFSFAQSLTDAGNACQGIVMKGGAVNSTLGGVRPSGVEAGTHPQIVTVMTELGGMVATAEAGLSASTDPVLSSQKGRLNAAYGNLTSSASYLCWCIGAGDLPNALGTVSIVRNDYQALRATATDIRGEIQKRTH